VPASSFLIADEETRYQTVVGPLPVLSNPATWAPVCASEEDRMGVAESLAHAKLRGIDLTRPSNPFAKHIAAMPHALVPSLDGRASPITVVRRSREVGYRRSYVGFMNEPPVDPPLVPTFEYIVTCPPFIDVSDAEGFTTAQKTTARIHQGGLTGHLVAWHLAESSRCPTATRSRFFLPTPAWWSGVKVPYGCMVKLP